MLKVMDTHNHFPSILYSNDKENIPNHCPYPLHKSDLSINPEDSKQKSELCRSYMEFGFCPYQKRCKFAHGSHQLLRNNQLNNKYKTKQCQNFKKNSCCMYGKRCNFIHPHNYLEIHQELFPSDILMRLARKQAQKQSKLLPLLHSL